MHRLLDLELSRRTALGAALAAAVGRAAELLIRAPTTVSAAALSEQDVLAALVVLEDTAVFAYSKLGGSVSAPSPGGGASSGSGNGPNASPSGGAGGNGQGGNGGGPGAGGAQSGGAGQPSPSSGAGGASSASSQGGAAPTSPYSAVTQFGDQHMAARDSLLRALRLDDGTPPQVDQQYPDAIPASADAASALAALGRLEGLLLGAQHAALTLISRREIRGLVVSILGTTARHQSVIATAQGTPVLAGAFITGDPAGAARLQPTSTGAAAKGQTTSASGGAGASSSSGGASGSSSGASSSSG